MLSGLSQESITLLNKLSIYLPNKVPIHRWLLPIWVFDNLHIQKTEREYWSYFDILPIFGILYTVSLTKWGSHLLLPGKFAYVFITYVLLLITKNY